MINQLKTLKITKDEVSQEIVTKKVRLLFEDIDYYEEDTEEFGKPVTILVTAYGGICIDVPIEKFDKMYEAFLRRKNEEVIITKNN